MPDFLPHAGMALGPLLALVVLVCVIEATLVLGTLAPGEIVLVLAAGIVDFRYLPFVVAAAALGSFIGSTSGSSSGAGAVTGSGRAASVAGWANTGGSAASGSCAMPTPPP